MVQSIRERVRDAVTALRGPDRPVAERPAVIGRGQRVAYPPAPPPVVEELQRLIGRARERGHPVAVPPTLVVNSQRGGRTVIDPSVGGAPRRIVLARDVLALPPSERHWVLAHELSHQLRDDQRGGRYPEPRWARPLTLVLLCSGFASTLGLVASFVGLLDPGRGALAGIAGALVLAVVAVLAVLSWWERPEEAAVDRTAAEVFGAVLSPAGVRRVRRAEGFAHLVPAVIRSHPRPTARRAAGLEALANRETATTGPPSDLRGRIEQQG